VRDEVIRPVSEEVEECHIIKKYNETRPSLAVTLLL